MLDEECVVPQGSDDGFLSKVVTAHGKNNFLVSGGPRKGETIRVGQFQFVVKHFAGDVSYKVTGFLDKNKVTTIKILFFYFFFYYKNVCDCRIYCIHTWFNYFKTVIMTLWQKYLMQKVLNCRDPNSPTLLGADSKLNFKI